MLTLRLHHCFICAIALVGGFQQPRHRCVPATRRSMMRDDERLFVGDAGMIVAAGATQKLVESFAAGDSILSPVTASDLDALPALFFSSGVWLLCWLVPATYRVVVDAAVSRPACVAYVVCPMTISRVHDRLHSRVRRCHRSLGQIHLELPECERHAACVSSVRVWIRRHDVNRTFLDGFAPRARARAYHMRAQQRRHARTHTLGGSRAHAAQLHARAHTG